MRRNPGVALVWLVLALALILASCSEDESIAPTTVLIAAEPAFAERTLELAEELLAPHGLAVAALGEGENAHISVGLQLNDGSVAVETQYWVLAVARSSLIWGLDVTSQAGPLDGNGNVPQLFVAAEGAPPLGEWWPEMTVRPKTLLLIDIQRALEANLEAVAVLPIEAVNAGVRSLPVQGLDIVAGEVLFGDQELDSYPLVERAWVSALGHDDAGFSLILDETKDALAKRLAQDYALPQPIILRATGDIMPARCVYAKQRDYGDFAHAFRELGPWLSEADITVGSLDASISDAGRPFGCTQTFSLLAPSQSVEGLVYAGFDVVTVATNHAKDCGQDSCGDQAFFDTLNVLRANGIEPVGGGSDLAEARAPAIVDVRGTTFAFLGYDEIAPSYHAGEGRAGVAPLTQAFLIEDIAALRDAVDVIVVLPQWGVEYTHDPTETQRSRAGVAVKSGADLVIGNHPHWVQAAEAFGTSFVAYALGNFVFDQDWSTKTQQGVVLEAVFYGAELKSVRLHPIRIVDQHQPAFANAAEAQEILGQIWDASAALP